VPRFSFETPLIFVYTLAIAFLMVSRLPVFSGKRVGKRIAPEMVLPVFVAVVLFFALLVAYPWVVLTTGTILYLAALPLGWLVSRGYQRKDAAAALQAGARVAQAGPEAQASVFPANPPDHAQAPQRPARLN
jgi:CDP-diacylglycerol--serine O-phosphatidyltransferase